MEYYMEKPICSIPFSMLRRFEDDGDRSEYEYSDKGYFVRRGHLETKLIAAWLYPLTADGVTIGNNNASMLLTITEGDATAHIHASEEKDHGGKPFTVWYVDFVANMPEAECSFRFKLS